MKKTKPVCFICDSAEVNDVELGEFKHSGKISVHYFCVLLASGLVQNGEDDTGILGFLPKDIKIEVERIKKLKCFYCKQIKANIGCCDKRCRRTFHTSCGLKNDCLMQFQDPYPAYCNQHIDQGLANAEVGLSSKRKKHTAKDLCTICYETMGQFHPINSVLSPCCKAHWFHKRCLMEFAKTAGYFFKCPMCNDADLFREAVKMRGIFVPDTDAAWETEPNAFAELLERPETCEAEDCVCPDGRDHEDTQYQIIRCDTCGSHCVHNKCLLTKEPYICGECNVTVASTVNASASNHQIDSEIDHNQIESEIENKEFESEVVDIQIDSEVEGNTIGSPEKENQIGSDVDIEVDVDPSTICSIEIGTDHNAKCASDIEPHSSANLTESADVTSLDSFEKSKSANIISPDSSKNYKSPTNNCRGARKTNTLEDTNISMDVEFVETKDEILCISDDDAENPPRQIFDDSLSKKRALEECKESPINPPSKRIRRALETMRNQSKITSFFNIIGTSKDAARG